MTLRGVKGRAAMILEESRSPLAIGLTIIFYTYIVFNTGEGDNGVVSR